MKKLNQAEATNLIVEKLHSKGWLKIPISDIAEHLERVYYLVRGWKEKITTRQQLAEMIYSWESGYYEVNTKSVIRSLMSDLLKEINNGE